MTLLARVAFALLVAATFAAFFVAQRLKSEPGVINTFRVVKYFSPNGDGQKDVQTVSFRLKEADDVTVDVVDADGGRVARLATARPTRAYAPVRLQWRGQADDRRRAPDGTYRIRIGLRRQGRSVIAPFAFFLDTRAPVPWIKATSQDVVSPGQPVDIVIRGSGPRARPGFTVLRTDVEGEPQVVRRFAGERGTRRARWDGLTDAGRPAEPGTYLIAVSVRDRSGNLGTQPRAPFVPGRVKGVPGITVRGLAVQPPVRPVAAGQLVSFRVDARGNSYRWSIRRVGESRPRKRSGDRKTTSIIAPRAPGGVSGVYLLEVRSGRYFSRVPFAVQGEERAPLLVVLPVISWLGRNPLDDPRRPDGIPNTLANGSPVPFPRLYAGEDGLPAGFAEEIAPLLVMLDRARIRYDITTDLALSLSREPRLTDNRPGIVFAGSARWVTRPLARRLRRYVADGGRVALFGPDSLRASVQVGATRLVRATPSGPTDAFGGRLANGRELEGDPPPALSATVEPPPDFPVFTAWDGFLGGFGKVEELVSPGSGAEVVAAIGQPVTAEEITAAQEAGRDPREEHPAVSAVKQGKGYVIRVGIDDWVERIGEGDAEVVQLTRNIVDLVRKVNPRPRSALR